MTAPIHFLLLCAEALTSHKHSPSLEQSAIGVVPDTDTATLAMTEADENLMKKKEPSPGFLQHTGLSELSLLLAALPKESSDNNDSLKTLLPSLLLALGHSDSNSSYDMSEMLLPLITLMSKKDGSSNDIKDLLLPYALHPDVSGGSESDLTHVFAAILALQSTTTTTTTTTVIKTCDLPEYDHFKSYNCTIDGVHVEKKIADEIDEGITCAAKCDEHFSATGELTCLKDGSTTNNISCDWDVVNLKKIVKDTTENCTRAWEVLQEELNLKNDPTGSGEKLISCSPIGDGDKLTLIFTSNGYREEVVECMKSNCEEVATCPSVTQENMLSESPHSDDSHCPTNSCSKDDMQKALDAKVPGAEFTNCDGTDIENGAKCKFKCTDSSRSMTYEDVYVECVAGRTKGDNALPEGVNLPTSNKISYICTAVQAGEACVEYTDCPDGKCPLGECAAKAATNGICLQNEDCAQFGAGSSEEWCSTLGKCSPECTTGISGNDWTTTVGATPFAAPNAPHTSSDICKCTFQVFDGNTSLQTASITSVSSFTAPEEKYCLNTQACMPNPPSNKQDDVCYPAACQADTKADDKKCHCESTYGVATQVTKISVCQETELCLALATNALELEDPGNAASATSSAIAGAAYLLKVDALPGNDGCVPACTPDSAVTELCACAWSQDPTGTPTEGIVICDPANPPKPSQSSLGGVNAEQAAAGTTLYCISSHAAIAGTVVAAEAFTVCGIELPSS